VVASFCFCEYGDETSGSIRGLDFLQMFKEHRHVKKCFSFSVDIARVILFQCIISSTMYVCFCGVDLSYSVDGVHNEIVLCGFA
jgi:hypothetical protein